MTPFDWPAPHPSGRASRLGKESAVMKDYTVTINGVETTLRLNEKHAKERGVWVDDEAEKKKPPAKARTAANKARTARNKSA